MKSSKTPLENRWISCTERLPDFGENVILYFRNDLHKHPSWPQTNVMPAWRCKRDGCWSIAGYLGGYSVKLEDGIAWMPLPTPIPSHKEVQYDLIYAVDFDGTLCVNKQPEIGEPNKLLIDQLKAWKAEGHKIILYTMREGAKLYDALAWCAEQGLAFDAVNDNLPELKKRFGNNPRKVYADYYIDDHNAPEEWLREWLK